MSRRAVVILLLTVALGVLAVPASAHVSVAPDSLEPGAFTTYTIRVPNERDEAATTAVEVQLPDGIELGSYRPVEGSEIEVGEGVVTIEGGSPTTSSLAPTPRRARRCRWSRWWRASPASGWALRPSSAAAAEPPRVRHAAVCAVGREGTVATTPARWPAPT